MKKLFILLLVSTQVVAQLQFTDASLSTAMKWGREMNKSIFVFYTSKFAPNGPQIEKDILGNDDVKNILYSKFICIKIDAETDEGMAFSKKYGINDAPSMVFMSAFESILYRKSNTIGIDEFIELAEKSLLAADENEPSKLYEEEFKNGRRDPEFLLKYINYLIDKREDNTVVLGVYLMELPESELTNPKILDLLSRSQYNGVIDGFYHKTLGKLIQLDTPYKSLLVPKYHDIAYNSVEVAADEKDEKLYMKADSMIRTWENPKGQRYEEFFRKVRFYATVKDSLKIKAYMTDIIEKDVMNASIKPPKSDSTARMIVWSSSIENASGGRYWGQYNSKMDAFLAVRLLNQATWAVTEAFAHDPSMLKKGLEWMNKAQELDGQFNNLWGVTKSKILFLNGQKEQAIQNLEKMIDEIQKAPSNSYIQQVVKNYEEILNKMKKNDL